MPRAIVVGGGVVGIYSAIQLTSSFDEVILIEREASFGGLFQSFTHEHNCWFDYGFHMPNTTGVPAVDDVLFGNLDKKEWSTFDYIPSGHSYNHKVNHDCPCPDIRSLDQEIYNELCEELLSRPKALDTYATLGEQLRHEYGERFTEIFFQPLIEGFYSASLTELAPNSHKMFGMIPVCFDEQRTKELKAESHIGDRIAFPLQSSRKSSYKYYYPRQGGIQVWVDHLMNIAQERGVIFRPNCEITSIKHDGTHVETLAFSDSEVLDCDLLMWTVPAAFFLRSAGLPSIAKGPPQRFNVSLFEIITDKPFETDLHYLTCHEEDTTIHQCTFYPNFSNGQKENGYYHMTVQVLSRKQEDVAQLEQAVLSDLERLNVLGEGAKILHIHAQQKPNAYPVPTHEFFRVAEEEYKTLSSEFDNVLFAGLASGPKFVACQLFVDAHNKIISYTEERRGGAEQTTAALSEHPRYA